MTAKDFAGNTRFKVQRRLGAGAFGVVYEAFDRERGGLVALKVLRHADAAALYRFKQEFRALADLSHPNLAALYELQADGEHWFFTMELLRGDSFLEHVRGEARDVDELTAELAPTLTALGAAEPRLESAGVARTLRPLSNAQLLRLRRALLQLAVGVAALHSGGKLHRDIKSSNVLVTHEGRAVLLDFGLAQDSSIEDVNRSVQFVGTPGYMSPEQGAGLPATEASDWYAVGVMLYEALTGGLPFSGRPGEIMADKQRIDPEPPATRVPGVPEDLDVLCRDLLRRDPAERPSAAGVLGRLRGSLPDAPVGLPSSHAERLYGRAPALFALEAAYLASRENLPVIAWLHGPPGIGKSVLARHFLDSLREREDVVVLQGRCDEREAVPYNALDSLVDALSQYLKRIDRAAAEALLPRDVMALARLFPVLSQVEAVAGARRRVLQVSDSQEQRRRAFTAMRELFGRLAAGRPVVLLIDDIHWGDADSASLLLELLRPPEPPPILLLCTYRTEEAAASPLLQVLLSQLPAGVQTHDVRLSELADDAARELTASLLGAQARPGQAEAIARESAGNPQLVEELVDGGGATGTSLAELVRARLSRLPGDARRLLEVVSMAGGPIALEVAARVASLDHGDQGALAALRASRLVRRRRVRGRDAIEAYSSRLRDAVVAQLSADERRAHHHFLALGLLASGGAEPERLAAHFQGAGDAESAAEYAEAAAAQAVETLAFERAARLFRMALDLHSHVDPEKRRLQRSLAESLANAGRGQQAAHVYLQAAEGALAATALELRRRAAEQLLVSGHIDEGFAVLGSVLGGIGMRLARTPRGALVSVVLRRALIRLRGVGFTERDETQVAEADLIRIDTCWSVATGLGLVDTIRGADFQARHLLLALAAGEPYRVARALAMEIGYSAIAGGRARERTAQITARAVELAERSGNPHAIALVTTISAIATFLEGRWREGLALAERGELLLRERCSGSAWELDSAQLYGLLCLFYLGDLAELGRRIPPLLVAARDRGDLYVETSVHTRIGYLLLLAADRPGEARVAAREAIERWSRQSFHLQHLWEAVAQAEVDLYLGDGRSALTRVDAVWPVMKRSLMLRIQASQVIARFLRARAALAAAQAGEAALLRRAERDAAWIERQRLCWATPLAALVRGCVAAARCRNREAVTGLAAAEAGLEAAEMHLHAAAVRRQRGRLQGGDEGRALIVAADAWLTAQQVRNPERLAAMLAPVPRW